MQYTEKHVWDIFLGRKTMTRRVVKWHDSADGRYVHCYHGDGFCRLAHEPSEPAIQADEGSIECAHHGIDYGCIGQLKTITSVKVDGGNLKWRVGNDYAVVPGRGKPAAMWRGDELALWDKSIGMPGCVWKTQRLADGWRELRHVITEIRREPLQAISGSDAIAEGCEPLRCPTCGGYGWVTYDMVEHDKITCSQCAGYGSIAPATYVFEGLWNSINSKPPHRWEDNPDVWVIRFEVVRA
jgi:hypothetical protein